MHRATVRQIRGNSVLPARREPVTLPTEDGLDLVGELATPVDRPPVATLVCLHPLPTQGGMMDSHLFRKAAYRLPALAGLAVLRFNTRGTASRQGRSEGRFDGGSAERFDVAAALDLAVARSLPAIWLVGWSFGTDLALRYGRVPAVVGLFLISPPLRTVTDADLAPWSTWDGPIVALVPGLDDYLRPDEARRRFARIPGAQVIGVTGARHLWVGRTERVLDEIVAHVTGAGPLPRAYDGPMELADVADYAMPRTGTGSAGSAGSGSASSWGG